jgi:hypothetical protein
MALDGRRREPERITQRGAEFDQAGPLHGRHLGRHEVALVLDARALVAARQLASVLRRMGRLDALAGLHRIEGAVPSLEQEPAGRVQEILAAVEPAPVRHVIVLDLARQRHRPAASAP